MDNDLAQQVAQQVPSLGAGGIGGGLVGFLTAFKLFAKPQDVELAKAEIRAEMAEKYVNKAEMAEIRNYLIYIRQRIDQIADKQG